MQQKGSLFENPKERGGAHLKLFLDAREESRDLAASLYVSLGAAEEQPVHAAAHVTEVSFVTGWKLGDGAAGVADFRESFAHGRPVHVTVTKIDPGVSIFLALEVFEVNLDDALAEGANPVLRKSVKHHVADVEPSLNPRALELADVAGHFERSMFITESMRIFAPSAAFLISSALLASGSVGACTTSKPTSRAILKRSA